ncbi:MAG TPA: thiamine phosphate synthase [Bryobacteraceae bacterium]|nr:thiamine phosphate synthase [Bryobacteraceae bacterium]
MRLKSFYPIRFYPVLDTELASRLGIGPVAAAAALLEAGAHILQFRHKGFFSRQTYDQAGEMASFCRQAGALFVMNDRADLARLLNAALHVGQDDLSPADARRILGEDAIVGYSTHNEAQIRAAAAEPVDYLALGPIFGTSTKQNPDPVVGLDELRRLRSMTHRPLVAIGGITLANALSVWGAGADSVAVVSDLFPKDGNIRARAEEWMEISA